MTTTGSKKTTAKKTTSKTTAKKKITKKKVAKKTVSKKVTPKKASPKKKAVRKVTASTGKKPVISNDQKRMMIAMHAYYKWEKAGFPGGQDWHHWLEAEREVEDMLK